jgi:hypothetical protein
MNNLKVISPAQMIQEGITKGSDLKLLKEAMELQREWEANEARKLFSKDFAAAQAKIIPVVKKKKNSHTNSSYAELSGVIEASQPIYTEYGFSVIFNEADCLVPNCARITAEVLHHAGHSKEFHLDIPLDGAGFKGNANMTPIQGKASSISYARRYLMCMIWNIPTSDIDGNNQIPTALTIEHMKQLKECLNTKEYSNEKFLKYLNIDSLEELTEKDYMKALAAVNALPSKSKSIKKQEESKQSEANIQNDISSLKLITVDQETEIKKIAKQKGYKGNEDFNKFLVFYFNIRNVGQITVDIYPDILKKLQEGKCV